MRDETRWALSWIRLGVAAGLATCVVYPAMLFLPLPTAGTATLAGLWGPLLGAASLGLARLLEIPRRSIAARLGALSNLLAGALVVAMLLVQIAVRARLGDAPAPPEIVSVWLGLDVAWDVYVGLGTLLLAVAAWRHPRFGILWAAPGMAVSLILLALNFATFPAPPGEAGLFDAGPLVALWYLVVTLRSWASLGWAQTVLEGDPT